MTLIYNDAESNNTKEREKKSQGKARTTAPQQARKKDKTIKKNNILHYLNFLLNYLTTFSHMKPQKLIGSKIKKYSEETEKKLKD